MNQRLISFLGLIAFIFCGWLLSNNRKAINYRIVFGGLVLQFLLAMLLLNTEVGVKFFEWVKDAITAVIDLSDEGAKFIFGKNFQDHFFAFKVLPTIIFVSSLTYLLFYFRFMQRIIAFFAYVMRRTMNGSGVDAVVASANIFCGQTEAPLFIRPYLKTMTVSEIHTMMTTGMASVAGGTLAAYVGFGISAGHLLTASLMSAPAAILISKMMFPETEVKKDHEHEVQVDLDLDSINAFEAACNGAAEGLKLALNVAAMLLAFISLVAFVNLILLKVTGLFGFQIILDDIFGFVFRPAAFLMGISWEESLFVGKLLGQKMVVNEFMAYMHLQEGASQLSERATVLTTYALCGFANFSSIAIQIGGMSALEPSRKKDFARCGFSSMIAGTLATLMMACIAGILI